MTLIDRVIIVPASLQSTVQTMCAKLAEGAAGEGMFIRGLCPAGGTIPTHFISSGPIEDNFAGILPLTTVTTTYDATGKPTQTVSTRPGNANAVVYLASQAGIAIDAAHATGLLASIDVSNQSPESAMSRMGLVFVPQVMP